MSKTKSFIIGAVVGSLMVGGVSFASDRIQIDVTFPNIVYWLDGKEIKSSKVHDGKFSNGDQELPLTITYKGTNYVPIRYLTDANDQQISWNKAENKVKIQSAKDLSFEPVNIAEAPDDIQKWVERSKNIRLGQAREYGGDVYVLVTRGEKSMGGYDVQIQSIRQYNTGYTVFVKLLNPPKGSIVIQPLTFPYELVKLNTPPQGAVKFTDQDGVDFPQLAGLEYVPEVTDRSNNIALFHPLEADKQIVIRGMVSAFEGVLDYSIVNGDNSVSSKGMVQATAGAPSWGYFHLDLPQNSIKQGMSVHFHLLSPKDGSEQEEVVYRF